MKKIKIISNKVRGFLIIVCPLACFFSFFPSIILADSDTMNIELSVTFIWLLSFAIFSIIPVIEMIVEIFKKRIKKEMIFFVASLLLPVYSTISLLWTSNFQRGILTVGVIWCIWLSVLSIFDYLKKYNKKNILLKSFYYSSIFVCIICWTQCLLDVFGFPNDFTQMCTGCVYINFGFPHPNGFTAEPQYVGNLLILPVLFSSYLFLNTTNKREKKKLGFFFCTVLMTLFITLSRGAIFSCAIGLFLLLIVNIRQKISSVFEVIVIAILSFALSCVAQGLFSELSPTDDTFSSGIAKSINQVSLGVIKINKPIEEKNSINTSDQEQEQKIKARHDGYIAASTDERMTMSAISVKLWSSNISKTMFGVGIGGAGKSLNEAYKEGGVYDEEFLSKYYMAEGLLSSPKRTVQNEYINILLELGIIGETLMLATVIICLIFADKSRKLFVPVLMAYAISFIFFSGLPNALHVFLLPPVLYCILDKEKLVLF